ncbi:hypothetical protein [Deinococcus multiflagellatus]|uniref:C-type lysozyme inhibitor domain-containing protein n=1 Tax=Deinococcus multiflagellatus TaxID=1656887 RepID=A0ABW1ZS84_9DEIO|nr:hypothetical protein [Deinococcus multiflagellatus]MBZ9714981.1 hypothetical protein [Deinococcus multiflagellatus]
MSRAALARRVLALGVTSLSLSVTATGGAAPQSTWTLPCNGAVQTLRLPSQVTVTAAILYMSAPTSAPRASLSVMDARRQGAQRVNVQAGMRFVAHGQGFRVVQVRNGPWRSPQCAVTLQWLQGP